MNRSHARLQIRCRRGMRELELLLQHYLFNHYSHAPAREKRQFENLLELPDPELYQSLLQEHDSLNPVASLVEKRANR